MSEFRLAEMAQFVVELGFTPAEYFALTVPQHQAIITAWNEKTKRESR